MVNMIHGDIYLRVHKPRDTTTTTISFKNNSAENTSRNILKVLAVELYIVML